MRVIEETYRSPTGATATFGVIHKADVALVVPFRPDRDLLRLVRP